MPLTEEEKRKRYNLYSLKWKHENKDKVKAYNAIVNKKPERKEKEKIRLHRLYCFKKECARLDNLYGCI